MTAFFQNQSRHHFHNPFWCLRKKIVQALFGRRNCGFEEHDRLWKAREPQAWKMHYSFVPQHHPRRPYRLQSFATTSTFCQRASWLLPSHHTRCSSKKEIYQKLKPWNLDLERVLTDNWSQLMWCEMKSHRWETVFYWGYRVTAVKRKKCYCAIQKCNQKKQKCC